MTGPRLEPVDLESFALSSSIETCSHGISALAAVTKQISANTDQNFRWVHADYAYSEHDLNVAVEIQFGKYRFIAYDIARQGRGVPPVPLVLVGVVP